MEFFAGKSELEQPKQPSPNVLFFVRDITPMRRFLGDQEEKGKKGFGSCHKRNVRLERRGRGRGENMPCLVSSLIFTLASTDVFIEGDH